MSTIFSKTGKGQEEIKARSGGLTQRVRQVLILVDGKRGVDALCKISPADGLVDTLQALLEQGYIEAIGMTAVPAGEPAPIDSTVPAETAPDPGGTVFRELPPLPATKDLELARNFMMNTLRDFNGPYATLSLVEKVSVAQSHAEMRTQFDHWIAAITETQSGKRRADELCRALLEII